MPGRPASKEAGLRRSGAARFAPHGMQVDDPDVAAMLASQAVCRRMGEMLEGLCQYVSAQNNNRSKT